MINISGLRESSMINISGLRKRESSMINISGLREREQHDKYQWAERERAA